MDALLVARAAGGFGGSVVAGWLCDQLDPSHTDLDRRNSYPRKRKQHRNLDPEYQTLLNPQIRGNR